METKLVLGYWGVQGLAQPVRYLLEYLEVPYEDKQYTDREAWGKDKESLGFDFPNVPYIIDGDYKLTESSALLAYVPVKAHRSDLLGGNEKDRIKHTQLLGVIGDIRKSLGETMWAPKDQFDTKKASAFKDTIIPKLKLLDKFLGSKDWLLGYISAADFVFAPVLEIISKMEPSALDDFKALKGLQERFFNLTAIKKYRESERFPKLITSPMATWTGQ